jgi:hypothetical protein
VHRRSGADRDRRGSCRSRKPGRVPAAAVIRGRAPGAVATLPGALTPKSPREPRGFVLHRTGQTHGSRCWIAGMIGRPRRRRSWPIWNQTAFGRGPTRDPGLQGRPRASRGGSICEIV